MANSWCLELKYWISILDVTQLASTNKLKAHNQEGIVMTTDKWTHSWLSGLFKQASLVIWLVYMSDNPVPRLQNK